MTYPTHAAFAAQLGTAFEVSGAAEAVALQLDTVHPPAGDASATGPSSFSLVFLGDAVLRLGQGTHLFSHAQLGEFALFIVPLGPARSDGRMQYEAVFN